VTAYSYSVSFAVALASRPILGLGRIWADGNLLRGAAGDLKVGGSLRIHDGHGDQAPDPLIAADKGEEAPAFRGTAYALFESLELGEFGNRIPALSFEILADPGPVTLAQLLAPGPVAVAATRELAGLQGFTLDAGPVRHALAALGQVYPMALDAGAGPLAITATDQLPAQVPTLPEPAAAREEEAFGHASGRRRSRVAAAGPLPAALRYYDPERDYQPGLQRAEGRSRPGQVQVIELPAVFSADHARSLASAASLRAGWARQTLAWRMAELDSAIGPGAVVRLPGEGGCWRVESWEWRDQGVELELVRLPQGAATVLPGDAGQALPKPDLLTGPTLLRAFELPWDGIGSSDAAVFAAATSSASAGWKGAVLYAELDGGLAPLGPSGAQRCAIGQSTGALAPSTGLLLDRSASLHVQLVAGDLALASTSLAGLAAGDNRALLGGEVIQFLQAEALGGGVWRLAGLLRGRGGTEAQAVAGHPAGTEFALLDHRLAPLDTIIVGRSAATAAIGPGDSAPVTAPIANRGISLKPLTPVHPRGTELANGGIALRWTRRARGGWNWPDEVELPEPEGAEGYRVGLGPVAGPVRQWETPEPCFALSGPERLALQASHPGETLWVRQVGRHALSDPLRLAQF